MKMFMNAYGHAEIFSDDEIVAIGEDPNGHYRCFGRGVTSKDADAQCWMAIKEYVKGRPDTGPLEKWRIVYE